MLFSSSVFLNSQCCLPFCVSNKLPWVKFSVPRLTQTRWHLVWVRFLSFSIWFINRWCSLNQYKWRSAALSFNWVFTWSDESPHFRMPPGWFDLIWQFDNWTLQNIDVFYFPLLQRNKVTVQWRWLWWWSFFRFLWWQWRWWMFFKTRIWPGTE